MKDPTEFLNSFPEVQPNIAFGLCDLGLGFPELGYVDLRELATIRGKMRLPIEPDKGFEGSLFFYSPSNTLPWYSSILDFRKSER